MRHKAKIWAGSFSRTMCIALGVLLVGASILALSVLFGGAGQFFGHDLKFYGITDMRPHLLTVALGVLPWVALVVAVQEAPSDASSRRSGEDDVPQLSLQCGWRD